MNVSFRFSFFAVLGFVVCTDREGTAILCLAACFMHELGHIAVMLAEGKPPAAITFYGGGIHISDGGSGSFCAAAGGCAANLMLSVVSGLIALCGGAAERFFAVNLLLAAINLIPIGALDGRLMLERASLRLFSPELALRISSAAEKAALLIVVPAVILLVIKGGISFSAVIFLIYLTVVDIFDKL